MSLPKGELLVENESQPPTYISSWSIDRKASELGKWLHYNFDPEEDHYFNFDDFENGDELTDELATYEESLESLIERVWGHLLLTDELRQLVERAKSKFSTTWYPGEGRVIVDELLEDEFDLDAVLAQIPRMLTQLELIEKNFRGGIGHNNGPSGLQLSLVDIDQAKQLARELQSPTVVSEDKVQSKLVKLANLCKRIGNACVKYMAQKADILVEGFVQTAGPEIGKWSARGMAVYLAGKGVGNFGEMLLNALN